MSPTTHPIVQNSHKNSPELSDLEQKVHSQPCRIKNAKIQTWSAGHFRRTKRTGS